VVHDEHGVSAGRAIARQSMTGHASASRANRERSMESEAENSSRTAAAASSPRALCPVAYGAHAVIAYDVPTGELTRRGSGGRLVEGRSLDFRPGRSIPVTLAVRAVFSVMAYLGVVIAPLVFAALGGGRPALGFWTNFSVALGFVGLAMMGLEFALVARFEAMAAPFGQDALLQFHRQIGYA